MAIPPVAEPAAVAATEPAFASGVFGSVPVIERSHPLRWLLTRPEAGPALVLATAVIAYCLIPVVWAAQAGTLRGRTGLLVAENQYLPVVPALLALICYYYRETSFLFDKLMARGVLTDGRSAATTRARLAEVVDDTRRSAAGRLGAALPFVIGGLAAALFLTNGSPPASRWPLLRALVDPEPHSETWLFAAAGVRPVAWYFIPAFHGIALGAVAAWAFGHLRVARVLSRVLRGDAGLDVRLRCPHPDGCMGLSAIADLVNQTVLVLIAISLMLFLWTGGIAVAAAPGDATTSTLAASLARLGANEGFVVAWSLYCGFAPLLFFTPLAVARQLMWRTKQETIAAAGMRVMALPPGPERTAADAAYRRIQRAPVWPFTWRTLSSFATSILLPLVLTVLSDIVLRWLGASS